MSKDQFDGGRWKLIWFYTVKEDSFDEVEVDDETLLKWQQELNDLTSKWIVKLAAIKDAIAGSDSDHEPSVEDPYDNPDGVVKKAPIKELKKVPGNAPKKVEEELELLSAILAEKKVNKTKPKSYDVTNISVGAPKKPVKKVEFNVVKKQVSRKGISDDEGDY
jgi:hypothetical protein